MTTEVEDPRAAETPASDPPPPLPRAGFKGFLIDTFGDDPMFVTLLVPFCFASMALYARDPLHTNFIFDEQEALLANPYVRSVALPLSKLHWLDAFHRDFWGLLPDRSIGSYRPIPDLVWRFMWLMGARDQSPFLDHWVNVLLHGVNAALLGMIAFRVTRSRRTAWLAGGVFVAAAITTEAVSGVVGIADVLGALGVLLAVAALDLPLLLMPLGVFAACLLGLFSKESGMIAVPLVPFAALLTAHVVHPRRPLRWARAGLSLVAAAAAFVLYVELRRRLFTAPLDPHIDASHDPDLTPLARAYHRLLRWYAQPVLPRDPINNPLVDATTPLRIAGALRVYAEGLGQVLFPWHLSGDYSAPSEPIPGRAVSPTSVFGAAALVLPLLVAPVLGVLGIRAFRREHPTDPKDITEAPWIEDEPVDVRPVVGVCLAWVVLAYFPVSNIPVLLPTVRAERFWYVPVLGTSLLLALAFNAILERSAKSRSGYAHPAAVGAIAAFLTMQCALARLHANDYKDDLAFWDATRKACPRSAKAHLNYSIMQGARGNLGIRLESNEVALSLEPDWPMANVYLGDTLCRLHRPEEAWPHYARGFELAPNDSNLIALGVQCLWDEKALADDSPTLTKLEELGEQHRGSWLAYIATDVAENGEEHHGVDPKYRPRGYNEGPKGD